ncbi:MAG: RibD family protein, partial [Pseudohongiella sp.]|nr:RibD family protein [Pseudohongiella sp.]
LVDNPSLNVRLEELSDPRAQHLAGKQPLRVVLDSALRTPMDARLFDAAGDVLLLCASTALADDARYERAGVLVRSMPMTQNGRVDLRATLSMLALDFDCNDVLIEAGPTLAGAMIQAGLVDELVIYMGAKLLGNDAMPLFKLDGLTTMADQIALKIVDIEQLGDDCRLIAVPSLASNNMTSTQRS